MGRARRKRPEITKRKDDQGVVRSVATKNRVLMKETKLASADMSTILGITVRDKRGE